MKMMRVKGYMMKNPDKKYVGPGVYSCWGPLHHSYVLANNERDAVAQTGTAEIYPMIPLLVREMRGGLDYQHAQWYVDHNDTLRLLPNSVNCNAYKHVLLGHSGFPNSKGDRSVPEYIVKKMLDNERGEFWLPVNASKYPANDDKNLIVEVKYSYRVKEVIKMLEEVDGGSSLESVKKKYNLDQ